MSQSRLNFILPASENGHSVEVITEINEPCSYCDDKDILFEKIRSFARSVFNLKSD